MKKKKRRVQENVEASPDIMTRVEEEAETSSNESFPDISGKRIFFIMLRSTFFLNGIFP